LLAAGCGGTAAPPPTLGGDASQALTITIRNEQIDAARITLWVNSARRRLGDVRGNSTETFQVPMPVSASVRMEFDLTLGASRVVLLAAMTILVAGVASCYPGEINSVGEADLVLTFFDSTADFTNVVTYAMPDTIIRVTEDGGSSTANPVVDAQALAQIEAEFTALGYQRVDVNGAEPDVIVLVTAARVDVDFWVAGGWWDYWGYWPGWGPGWGPCCYGPGYGPGYPWAPVHGGTATIGTLVITMLDHNKTPAEPMEIPAVWTGVINGLLQGSDANIVARLEGLIGQAFDQSPYL